MSRSTRETTADAARLHCTSPELTINVGATSGIKVGDKFRVFKRGEELVDPATGAKLGAEEKQTGSGVVTEVNEKFSIMTLTGTAGAGDILKK